MMVGENISISLVGSAINNSSLFVENNSLQEWWDPVLVERSVLQNSDIQKLCHEQMVSSH